MCFGGSSAPKPQVPAPPPPPPSEDEVSSPVLGDGYGERQSIRAQMGRSKLKIKRNFNLNIPTSGSGMQVN